MTKFKILFVCVHNSARSQMAEGWLRHLGDEFFEVESAGLEPGVLSSNAIKVMKEVGVDISSHTTKEIFDLFRKGRIFNAVIAVCHKEAAEACPIFPGVIKREVWSFADPSSFMVQKSRYSSKPDKCGIKLKSLLYRSSKRLNNLNIGIHLKQVIDNVSK